MRKTRFLAAALFACSLAQAQQDTASLDEVIITANKIPQKQSTTGKVITVINREQIERNAGRTLAQLLNEQAGITIAGALNNWGSPQSLFLRGASAGRTLVLLDGIPVYDPSLINNEFDLNLFSLNAVESIEICRGAQSTLYGSDAVAGVINIITAKKETNSVANGRVSLSGGNYGTFRGNADLYGTVGKLSYTARYGKLVTKGFSQAYDKSGKDGFERDSHNSNVARAGINFQASEALSFRTFAQYNGYRTELDASAFTDETDFTVKNGNWITGAGFTFKKTGVQLTGNYQYSDVSRNYLNDSLHRPGFNRFVRDNYFGKNQFVELFANITLGKTFSLLQGADYRHTGMNSDYYSLSSFGPFTSSFRDTTMSQGSMYSSLIYHSLNEKLNIELGGRLNVHSRYGSNHTYTFNPSYTFSPQFRAFGSIAKGFKAPSLYQLYAGGAGNRDLKAEESKTYEVGVQQTHNKVQNRLVFFHRNIKNGIDYNYTNFRYFNFQKQKVNGLEWETKVFPVKGLVLSANYTFLNPEEQTQSRVTFRDTTYEYLLRRPEHNINVTAGYSLNNSLYASVSGKYVSDRYDIGGYKVQDVPLDSYFLLNAYAEYRFPANIKVFADAQNITGKRFFDINGYSAIPFLISAGVSFSW